MFLKATEAIPLLKIMALLCPDSSKTRQREFISQGRVLVDGIVATRGDLIVEEGQKVELLDVRIKFIEGLKVFYEDAHLVVIDKPSGLLSVASNFEKEETVHALLKKHYAPHKVYVIHRLDFETSGLMVFAKTETAYERLKEELAERKMKREYVAVVEGTLTGSGTWKSYLREDAAYHVHSFETPKEGCELAITHYESLKHNAHFSLLACRLETGKKNQIRVHAASASHPVVGDAKYGAKTNKLGRIALHAEKLSFSHPETKKMCTFSSPIPSQFHALFSI